MLDNNVYEDIAERCGGKILIGVAGPARTGKSTLAKKFVTELIISNVSDADRRNIEAEELPITGHGSGVITTQFQSAPLKAAEVRIGNAAAAFAVTDCIGLPVDGATGFDEDGSPRLVNTPFGGSPLPLSEAAVIGTERVLRDNCTIGILVTCDGSIAGIPRQGYVTAEERAARILGETGKPFVILLNCSDPDSSACRALRSELEQKYNRTVIAVNCENLDGEGIMNILRAALFEFPVTSFDVNIPEWMRYLTPESTALCELFGRVRNVAPAIGRMRDCSAFDEMFLGCEYWKEEAAITLNLSEGRAEITASAKDGIFFDLLSEIAGDAIADECSLMRYVSGTAEAKRSYDKMKDAFECARINGYGIVQPDDSDMTLEQPKVVRQGGSVGIKLRATAPSYHIVKIDVCGEVSPIMGSAAQSESIVQGMMNGFETNPDGMWETNVFGKSLRGMVKEGLAGKVSGMQEDTKTKMRRALTRIINEGKGGVICILL